MAGADGAYVASRWYGTYDTSTGQVSVTEGSTTLIGFRIFYAMSGTQRGHAVPRREEDRSDASQEGTALASRPTFLLCAVRY
eukprot:2627535-Rhodomonas_salina.1